MNKYNAVKVEVDGFIFDSKAEGRRYSELKLLERAGEIKDLRLQPKFTCAVNGKVICHYIADFHYFDSQTQSEKIEDVKGMKTPVYKLKKRLFEALYNQTITEIT